MSQDEDEDATGSASDLDLAPLPIDLLPWHDAACDRLTAAVAAQRLSHGLLLQGPAGVGKERFASALAAALFCTGRGERLVACGECAECVLSKAGTHPDLHWLRIPEDKKSIGVDQVREVCEQLAMTSMRRGYRVAVIAPAEKMTSSAQNALLKTLEEPAPRTVLVLVTARPSALLATLRSRCQRIEVARPGNALALRWLAETLGSVAVTAVAGRGRRFAAQGTGAGTAFRRTRGTDGGTARRIPGAPDRCHARRQRHAGRGPADAPRLARSVARGGRPGRGPGSPLRTPSRFEPVHPCKGQRPS